LPEATAPEWLPPPLVLNFIDRTVASLRVAIAVDLATSPEFQEPLCC
jgi:hypothetical protein